MSNEKSNEVLTKVGNKAEWAAGDAYHVIKMNFENGSKTGLVSYNKV